MAKRNAETPSPPAPTKHYRIILTDKQIAVVADALGAKLNEIKGGFFPFRDVDPTGATDAVNLLKEVRDALMRREEIKDA